MICNRYELCPLLSAKKRVYGGGSSAAASSLRWRQLLVRSYRKSEVMKFPSTPRPDPRTTHMHHSGGVPLTHAPHRPRPPRPSCAACVSVVCAGRGGRRGAHRLPLAFHSSGPCGVPRCLRDKGGRDAGGFLDSRGGLILRQLFQCGASPVPKNAPRPAPP